MEANYFGVLPGALELCDLRSSEQGVVRVSADLTTCRFRRWPADWCVCHSVRLRFRLHSTDSCKSIKQYVEREGPLLPIHLCLKNKLLSFNHKILDIVTLKYNKKSEIKHVLFVNQSQTFSHYLGFY